MTKHDQQQHQRGKSLSALLPHQRHVCTGSQSPSAMRSSLLFDRQLISREQPSRLRSSFEDQAQVMIPFQSIESRQRCPPHSGEIQASAITTKLMTSLSDNERLFNALQPHSDSIDSPSGIHRGRVPLAMRLRALPPRIKPPPESCLPALPPLSASTGNEIDLCKLASTLSLPAPNSGYDSNTDLTNGNDASPIIDEENDVTLTPEEDEMATSGSTRPTQQILLTHEEVQKAKNLLNRLAASPLLIQWALCSLDTLNSHCQEEALALVDTLLALFEQADIDVQEAHWTVKAITSFVEETTKKAGQIDEIQRHQSLDLFEGPNQDDGLYRAKRIREIVKSHICSEDEFDVWAAWKRIEHSSSSAHKEIDEYELLTASHDLVKADEIDYDERQHGRRSFLQQYRARYRHRQNLRQSAEIEDARPLCAHLAEARIDARASLLEDWSCLDLPSLRHRLPLVQRDTKEKLAMYESMLQDAHAKIEELHCRVSILERAAVVPRSPTSTSSASAYSTFSVSERGHMSHDSSSNSSASDHAKAKFFDGVLFAMATPPRSKRHHRMQSDLPHHEF